MDDVYHKYAKIVYRYLLSLSHNSDTAEELTQETFYQAIRSSGKYDGSCKISTWLCAIAKNVFYTFCRKNPEYEELTENVLFPNTGNTPESPSAESEALRTLERLDVFRQLHLLKDPFREVLYLRIFGDLSFREIGEVMGKTENWARVTFYRGKEKLQKDIRNGSDNTDLPEKNDKNKKQQGKEGKKNE